MQNKRSRAGQHPAGQQAPLTGQELLHHIDRIGAARGCVGSGIPIETHEGFEMNKGRGSTQQSCVGNQQAPSRRALRVDGLFNGRWRALREVATNKEGVAVIRAMPGILAALGEEIALCEQAAPAHFGRHHRSKERYRLLSDWWTDEAAHSTQRPWMSQRETRKLKRAALKIEALRRKHCPLLFGSQLRELRQAQPTGYRVRQPAYIGYVLTADSELPSPRGAA